MFLILVLIVNLVGAILLLITGASNGGAGASDFACRHADWPPRQTHA